MKKLLITSLLLLLSFIQLEAQETTPYTLEEVESVKPLRVGVRLGTPHIITGNVEYVTPLLNNRVAFTLDYMSLSKTVDDVSINYNNFEFGTNVYLSNTGKGLYGAITYFSFKSEGTYTDVDFISSTNDGTGKIDFSTFNLKIGAKLGRTFYFRAEVGYGFGKIPEFIVVESNTSTETTLEEIPEIPGISNSGLLIVNIGIGFSFL